MLTKPTRIFEGAALWLFGALPMAVVTVLWVMGTWREFWPPTPTALVFDVLWAVVWFRWYRKLRARTDGQ